MSRCSGQLSYRSFAIECSGATQGLMIVNTIYRCKLPQQSQKHRVPSRPSLELCGLFAYLLWVDPLTSRFGHGRLWPRA
jgi:hypothetical protein